MPLDEAEEALGGMAYEHAVVYDGQGRQLARWGPEDTQKASPGLDLTSRCVVYPSVLDEIAKSGDGLYTHNHPSGAPPSIDDLLVAHRGNVAEIRAVANGDGFTWVVKRPAGGWPSLSNMRAALREISDAAYPAARAGLARLILDAGGNPADGPAAAGYCESAWRKTYADALPARWEQSARALGLVLERVPHRGQLGLAPEVRDGVRATPGARPPAAGGPPGARDSADIAFDDAAALLMAERLGRAGPSGRPLGKSGRGKGKGVSRGVGAPDLGDSGDDIFSVVRDPSAGRYDPQTPGFRTFIEGSAAVNADKTFKVLYIGTTPEFDALDPELANVQNHHGRASYMSSPPEDVSANYATRTGPDITNSPPSTQAGYRFQPGIERVDIADDRCPQRQRRRPETRPRLCIEHHIVSVADHMPEPPQVMQRQGHIAIEDDWPHLSRTASSDRRRTGQTDPVIGARTVASIGHTAVPDRAMATR